MLDVAHIGCRDVESVAQEDELGNCTGLGKEITGWAEWKEARWDGSCKGCDAQQLAHGL